MRSSKVSCVRLLGSTQPGRLAEYIRRANDGGAGDDGLIQRFGFLVCPIRGRDEYGGVLGPEVNVGVLPAAWADPNDRSNRRRCRDEVSPGADAVTGVVGNVQASLGEISSKF
jgi:hypothetical protein